MKCPSCRATTLMEIGLQLQRRQVTMRSCSHCELRWWEKDGERTSLPSVLELVASH